MKKVLVLLLFSILIYGMNFSILLETIDIMKSVILVPSKVNDLALDIRSKDACGAIYSEGDSNPVIYARPNTDGYIMIFHISAKGQTLLLWPDPFEDSSLNSFVKKGQEISIPSAYYFNGDYSGTEFIQGFLFITESKELEQIKIDAAEKALKGKYIDNNPIEQIHFMKDMVRKDPKSWTSNGVKFFYNFEPSMTKVVITLSKELADRWYLDGMQMDKKSISEDIEPGKHLIYYYLNGERYQEVIEVGTSPKEYKIPSVGSQNLGSNPDSSKRKVFLFSVGISDYKDSNVNDLPSPEKDAKDLLETVSESVKKENGNFDSLLLLNSQATKKAMTDFLKTGINKKINQDTEVIIYFYGHGSQIPDKNFDERDGMDEVLVPYDYSNGNVDSLIVDDELYNYFKAIAANSKNLLIIFDSCFSGSSQKGIKGIEFLRTKGDLWDENEDSMQSELKAIKDNFIFISASQGNEKAWDDPKRDLGNSLFTHFFLEAIKGKADKDYDKKTTVDEIYEYISDKMEEWLSANELKSQKPVFENPSDRIWTFSY